jgi:hypothetical protein
MVVTLAKQQASFTAISRLPQKVTPELFNKVSLFRFVDMFRLWSESFLILHQRFISV